MTRFAHKFGFWALVQVCILVAIIGWRFYTKTYECLANPRDGDLYAHTWSFQAIAFSVFAVPLCIVVMVVLLWLERFTIRKISKRKVIDEKTVA